MKIKDQSASKEKSTITVAPSAFVPLAQIVNSDDLHYRKVNPEFAKELAADIEANGLDTPISTWGGGEEQTQVKIGADVVDAHYLVAGLHRRAALIQFSRNSPEAFKKRFPNGIPVIHRLGSVADMLALQVRENVQRREMQPEEIFPVLKELSEDHGLKNREIAKKVGKSDAWVSQMLSVNEVLDPETQKEVMEGKIGVTKAAKLASGIKKDIKAGKTVTKSDIRARAAEVKDSTAGRERSEKRIGAGKFWARYQSLPTLNTGRKLVLLENALRYLANDTSKLEPEWRTDAKASKVTQKVTVKPAAKK